MRFTFVAVVMAVIAGTGLASPIALPKQSLVTEVGSAIQSAAQQAQPNVDLLETRLKDLLGDSLTKIEKDLGVPFAQKLVTLLQTGVPTNTIQVIGEAVALLKQNVDISAVDAYVKSATGGTFDSVENALGISGPEKILGVSL